MNLLVLGLLVIGAFLLRTVGQWTQVFAGGQVWFREVDPWYHMRLVDYLVQNFPFPLKYDMFAVYPGGASTGYMPLLTLLIAGLGKIYNYEVIGALLPPILGALVLIPVYFMGKTLSGNPKVGLLAALIVGILPSELFQRSLLGFTDHHILETLFSTSTILFLLLSNKTPTTLKWPLLSGTFLGLYLLSWQGGMFILLPIGLWVISCRRSINRRNSILAFTTGALIYTLTLLLLDYPAPMLRTTLLSMVGLITGVWILRWVDKRWKMGIMSSMGLAALFFVYLQYPTLIYSLKGIFLGGLGTTISEATPSTPQLIANIYGLTFLLFLGGLIVGIKKLDPLFIIWSLVLMLAALGQRRWGYYFVVPNAILASYFVFYISKYMTQQAKGPAVALTVIFILFTSLTNTFRVATLPNNISPEWKEALTWLKDNIESPFKNKEAYYQPTRQVADYGVLSWWDYGHWILRISKQVPYSSPTQYSRISDGAFWIAKSEDEANKIMESENIKYLILHREMLGGKWWALVQRGGGIDSKELRDSSLAMRLWSNKQVTWTLIHDNGLVKIFERRP